MMDQKSKFTSRGLVTEFVGEAQANPHAADKVVKGEVQLVLISPESLLNNYRYKNMLLNQYYKDKLVALVVDEAHCVKMWGDEFRTAFSLIGDLRSLLPAHVRVMALTATATNTTLSTVVKRWGLSSPNIIGEPPHRLNIMYSVIRLKKVDQFSSELCEETRSTGILKTIVFCRRYQDCSDMYLSLQSKLGKYFTDPAGYPNLHKYRIIEMYTRATTPELKEKIVKSFSERGGRLKLIFATTAFGMGVDCPDVRRIIHYGTPTGIEQYVQETGRAGRDGKPSYAILVWKQTSRHCKYVAVY